MSGNRTTAEPATNDDSEVDQDDGVDLVKVRHNSDDDQESESAEDS